MTAPGQEPDEVLTAKPSGKDDPAESIDLNAVGDNHMPEDVREAVREEGREQRERAEREYEEAREHGRQGDAGAGAQDE
jgi:predicted ABC-class ATPase